MPPSEVPVALETASPRTLAALVPDPREPGGIDSSADETTRVADEIEVYVAELIAKAPPLPAKLTALLRTP